MPRITKAEVRASMLAEPKPFPKEEKTREKIEKVQPATAEVKRTEVAKENKKPGDQRNKTKRSNFIPVSSDKKEVLNTLKKMSISNIDPTVGVFGVAESKDAESKEEAFKKRISELEKENEELNETIASLQNVKLDIDTLVESYENKLKQAHEEYTNTLVEKNEEISSLKSELLSKEKELEEVPEEEVKRNIFATIIAYLLSAIVSIGILGAVGILVFKLLSALLSWLF